MRSRTRIVCAVASLVLLGPAARAQDFALAPLVLKGDAAPGTGTTFSAFTLPVSVSDAGFAFVADLAGFGGSSQDAIFADAGSGLTLIAKVGDPAPVPGGATFTYFWTPSLNAAGEAVFHAGYSNGSYLQGLFRWSAGTITPVLLQGDPAPGAGLTFDQFTSYPSQNAPGDVAFVAQVLDETGSSATGIFLWSEGSTSALVWEYTDVPGLGGVQYNSLSEPVLNDAGQVAFVSSLSGPDSYGIFRITAGTTDTLWLQLDPLPGTGGGIAPSNIHVGRIGLNASGDVAFRTIVNGGSVGEGVFRISGGGVAPVALLGEAAPGTGGTYSYLYPGPVIDALGHVTFVALVTGGSLNNGLFAGDGGSVWPVALYLDPLPGTGGGMLSGPSQGLAVSAGRHVGFDTQIWQGVASEGLFRATPLPPAPVPALGPWAGGALVLLLGALGARRLAA
jgi:hypothetical protein